MVVRCSRWMGFKRSSKSTVKNCMRKRGQRGRGFGKFFKKAKCLVKKAVKSDLGKLATSQGLAYAPKSSTHWWSFLDTEQKDTLFLFDSMESYRLLNFIVQNYPDIFNKLIPGQFKQIYKKDK